MNVLNVFWLTACHLAALGCFVYYSRGAMMAGMAAVFLVGIGITVGFHRLLTHRSFKTYRWLRRLLACLGTLAVQRGPAEWVAIHRMHHAATDTDQDPLNAKRGFWFSYAGWLFIKQPQFYSPDLIRRFSRDITDDPLIAFLSRDSVAYVAQFILFGVLWIGPGLDYAFFCTAGRLVVNYNFTFLVNAAGHRFGTRNYEVPDQSTNLHWLALLTLGEAYHNNHHGEPSAAINSRLPGDFDFSGWLILKLEKLGLVWDVVLPATSEAFSPWALPPARPERYHGNSYRPSSGAHTLG